LEKQFTLGKEQSYLVRRFPFRLDAGVLCQLA
jgi:hypothetical protein